MELNFRAFIMVAAGGALGSVLRFAASLLLRYESFPLATLLINALGSFVIGLVFGAAQRGGWLGGPYWLLLATGLCGGFTTFSAFSLENVRLLQGGHIATALFYTLASVAAGVLCCWAGVKLTQ